MKKKGKLILLGSIILIVAVELFLRIKFGFCDAVLMQQDPDYEYIAQPNQVRYRFGKHIQYNEFSMRSEPVDTASNIILGFGDSILNGGTLTEQDSLATTFLSDSLTKRQGKKYQVLNISAGSWGPDNCAAYLKKHGDFSAKYAFLEASSHDAFDNMEFSQLVGVDPNYPKQQYPLAIIELLDRYLIPRTKALFSKEPEENLGINKGGSQFNKGFALLSNYFVSRNIPFFISLHPELVELKAAKYNKQGELIKTFCKKNNIRVIEEMSYLDPSDYRDDIHLNEKGQRKLFQILYKQILNEITTDLNKGS